MCPNSITCSVFSVLTEQQEEKQEVQTRPAHKHTVHKRSVSRLKVSLSSLCVLYQLPHNQKQTSVV